MARKQYTQGEKAVKLRARADMLESGLVVEKTVIQLPFADYLRTDQNGVYVQKFPKRVKNVSYFVHLMRGSAPNEEKFKIWLKPSKAGSGMAITVESIQPLIEFPVTASISWKTSAPSHFGTVTAVSEQRQGADLLIGVTFAKFAELQAQADELKKALEEQTARNKTAKK